MLSTASLKARASFIQGAKGDQGISSEGDAAVCSAAMAVCPLLAYNPYAECLDPCLFDASVPSEALSLLLLEYCHRRHIYAASRRLPTSPHMQKVQRKWKHLSAYSKCSVQLLRHRYIGAKKTFERMQGSKSWHLNHSTKKRSVLIFASRCSLKHWVDIW